MMNTSAPIVIDKHELHCAWPVYAQPDVRHTSIDGVTLTVSRRMTCHGPGDRVTVQAVIKSDSPMPEIIRAYEFALREIVVFRPSPQTPGGHMQKKAAGPTVRSSSLGEQKVPVNAQLLRGMHHTVELGCVIPTTHTSTTVSSGKNIEVSYVTHVRALLEGGKVLTLDLPVLMSNWPR